MLNSGFLRIIRHYYEQIVTINSRKNKIQRLFIAAPPGNGEQNITSKSTYDIIGYDFYEVSYHELPAKTPINKLPFDFLLILLGAYDNNRNLFHHRAAQEAAIDQESIEDSDAEESDNENPYGADLALSRAMFKNAIEKLGIANQPEISPKTYEQKNAAFDLLLTELARQGVKLCQNRIGISNQDVAALIKVIEKSEYMKANSNMDKLLFELRQFNSAPKP